MTPEQADRLFDGVMLASPMVAAGLVLLVLAFVWPRMGRE